MHASKSAPAVVEALAALPLLLRLPSVMRMTGLGRSTIYKLMAEAKFPTPVRLSGRVVAWRLADLEEWSHSRPKAAH
jgi:prophage regulatory protein